jgi:L-alanine-DL-glutamate epimerase-like enolase superfamily enzyme
VSKHISAAPEFAVTSIELYERPVVLRIPFRFGAATVTHAPQAFVRARISFPDGRDSTGAAAELMVPKWFDKAGTRTNEENIDDLRRSLAAAADRYTDGARMRSAFAHFAVHYPVLVGETARAGGNALLASYGAAVIDRAVIDALCRALGLPFARVIAGNLAGIDASLTPDLAGFDLDAFLATLTVADAIDARHTVGMLDPLNGGDGGATLDDDLPRTLRQVIARYGNRYFKLKLSGDPESDVARLIRIAGILDSLRDYRVTLDGNEQFESLVSIDEFWRRTRATPALTRLVTNTLYLEQPLPRSSALRVDVSSLGTTAALLIDESDATLDAFPAARSLGYTGVSSKGCKGFYKSLLNAARCARWNDDANATRFFLSAEDLTTQAGLAVQQDLALASLLGLRHVERNGHHYVHGFSGQGASDDEQRGFLAAHADLYESHGNGTILAIRDGRIGLRSLDHAGFASCAMPAWNTMQSLPATHSVASPALT